MKNFNELKNELDQIKISDIDSDLTKLIFPLLIIYSKVNIIETLLIKLFKHHNIELKDDDGNVIDFDEYIQYVDKSNLISFIELMNSSNEK